MSDVPRADQGGLGMVHPVPEMFLNWDLTHPSAWIEHAPFMGWIVGRHRPRTFVELGTHWGMSYFAACAAAKAIGLQMEGVAVDTWAGEEHAGIYGDEVYNYVRHYNDTHFGRESYLFRGYFDDAAVTVADGTVDLLHIDGLHTYDAVRHDFETWLPKVSARGVVMFHDIAERQEDFGVHRLWAEISTRYPSFRFLHGHGLGVLAVGAEVGAEISWLCEQDRQPSGDAIRMMFREYGRAASLTYGVGTAATALHDVADTMTGGEAHLDEIFLGGGEPLRPGLLRVGQAVTTLRTRAEAAEDERDRATRQLDVALEEVRRLSGEEAKAKAGLAELTAQLQGSRRDLPRAATRRVRAQVGRVKRQAARLRAGSPDGLSEQRRAVFDPGFYRREYPDVAASAADPWKHYLDVGAAEGRRPSVLFDPQWYQRMNPDLPAGTDPLVHFLTEGWQTGLDPIPEFDTSWYLARNPQVAAAGVNPLLHFIREGASAGLDPSPAFDTSWYVESNADVAATRTNPLAHYLLHGRAEHREPGPPGLNRSSVQELIVAAHPEVGPLRIVGAAGPPRVNLLIESMSSDRLLAGGATAVMLAAEWARRTERVLRVVCREQGSDAGLVAEVLRIQGVQTPSSLEVVRIPEAAGDFLEVGPDDVFLTTSWATTQATLGSLPADRVAYLVQEDESELYPAGFERRCVLSVLERPDLTILVSTRGLLDHLVAARTPSLAATATAFEPAPVTSATREGATGRRNLWLLPGASRGEDSSSLLGLLAIDKAIEQGALDTAAWQIHLAGSESADVSFCDGSTASGVEGSGWADLVQRIASADVVLLVAEADYPLGARTSLTANGAVVVTGALSSKNSESAGSDSVIEVPLTVEGLLDGLLRGVTLVEDPNRDVQPSSAGSPWERVGPAIDRLLELGRGV